MNRLLVVALGLLMFLSGCGEKHFISDSAYRRQVEEDFQKKKEALPNGNLFSVLDNPELTAYEREALTFLYAYMPLADIVDYPADFHLMNIRSSVQTREEMPWGKNISEELFRHFVLPVRINNENLDSARVVFSAELKERVKKLSLYDAILEVNHWCHEKAVYTPSDARTSAPLATVRTAYGRCGEESTLLVAALRSVGIPARQVYTPRWAHTDDNHAWVEAWADGKWYFLGACEPEPVLNLGWFNAPAGRGMLMHTKVFGRYNGSEEVMTVTANYTEINVVENYAPTASAIVLVVDSTGTPVPDARAEFKLYNYAEFNTVASKQTDGSGQCGLTAGKGDMLVWASKDGRFGFGKLSFGTDTSLTVTLDHRAGDEFALDIDIVPPAESAMLPEVTPEQRAENDRRLAYEDSIRNAYVATFMDDTRAREFATRHGLNPDVAAGLLVASRGNHATITSFMASLSTDAEKQAGLTLLQNISAKDLRDVSIEVLKDNMTPAPDRAETTIEAKYIRNPRVSYEILTPYKQFFNSVISAEEKARYQADPSLLIDWVHNNIRLDATCNLGSCPISPEGVWKARVADARSRDFFFVAIARSMGIAACVNEVTGKVQLVSPNDMRRNVDLSDMSVATATNHSEGWIKATYKEGGVIENPKYYSHFTLSKLTDEGRLQLLTYDEGDADMGEGATWKGLLKEGTRLEPGTYMLVSGTRLASGSVLARLVSLNITSGNTTFTELVMREKEDAVQVIGQFNSESLFTPINEQTFAPAEKQSILQACGRGYYVIGILGVNQEPTNHALRDIAALKADLEKWNRKMVLLFPGEEQAAKFSKESFPALPSTVIYGIDSDGIAAQIAEEMKLKHKESLPIFIIADTFNRVVFVSQGYTIGLGEQLMKKVKAL